VPTLAPKAASSAVESLAGPLLAPPTWRWWRWLAELPGDRIAFVAEDSDAWSRLVREAALLERLASTVSFTVPEVIAIDASRGVQVRRKVAGLCGIGVERLVFGTPDELRVAARYRVDCPISSEGWRLAADLGRALAELHGAVPVDTARALGFPETSYVTALESIRERLAANRDLDDLRDAIPPLVRWFTALEPVPVLAHRDVHAHNIAVDSGSGALLGIFDFEDAAVGHRADDFKFFPSFGMTFTVIAIEAYARAGGMPLTLEDVVRFHALAALEHFLHFTSENARWTQIVEWSRHAVRHVEATTRRTVSDAAPSGR
jgi:aminoglycoside phosphotransferase (APT) family kinase protein